MSSEVEVLAVLAVLMLGCCCWKEEEREREWELDLELCRELQLAGGRSGDRERK